MTLIALLVVLNQADAFPPPPMVTASQADRLPSPPMVTANPREEARRPAVSDAPFSSEGSEELIVRATSAEPETRRAYEVAIPGAVVALGAWVGGWYTFFSSINCHNNGLFSVNCSSASALLLIPQAGPWLAMLVGGTSDPFFANNLGLGIAQLAGLAAMVTGFAISVPVDDGVVAMKVVPAGNGVGLSGTF